MTNNDTADSPTAQNERITAWLQGRLPEGWVASDVVVDRDEITIVVDLLSVSAVPTADLPDSGTTGDTSTTGDTGTSADTAALQADDVRAEEVAGRINRFREETRAARVQIARETERRYERKVAWGIVHNGETTLFTTLAVPVMTRLRQPERLILDTLVESGVARSRAHALSWCVSLVGEHSAEWLGELRRAMTEVERVRATGPTS